jgi:hypothetical protein
MQFVADIRLLAQDRQHLVLPGYAILDRPDEAAMLCKRRAYAEAIGGCVTD